MFKYDLYVIFQSWSNVQYLNNHTICTFTNSFAFITKILLLTIESKWYLMDAFCIKLIKLQFSIAYIDLIFESINGNSVYPKFKFEMYINCIVLFLFYNSIANIRGNVKDKKKLIKIENNFMEIWKFLIQVKSER